MLWCPITLERDVWPTGTGHPLANRGAVIHQGRICQTGDITTLFEKPGSLFAARFVGMKNIMPARIQQGKVRIKGSDAVIETSMVPDIDQGYIGIRPEDIVLLSQGADNSENSTNRFCGTITRVASQGMFVEVHVESGCLRFEAAWPRRYIRDFQIAPGREATIAFSPQSVHVFQNQPY